MYNILVVDDEQKIRELIKKYALFEGYNVQEAKNGIEAIEICKNKKFDIIIMDVMMPELDGFSACKEIRKTCSTPVIMLSARGEEYDKIHGFEVGVDDYVVKPFSPKVLMLRINAILKRTSNSEKKDDDIIKFKGISIDVKGRIVYVDDKRFNMTAKEYDLFYYLVKNERIALTRDKIMSEVWGYDFYGDERTLDTHIKLIRKSLGKYSNYIVTLRGVGYRFEAEKS